jgi:polyisoprenoid-binding protein YceI
MRTILPPIATVLGLALFSIAPASAADTYAVDPLHTSVTFKIQHLGISWVHGRFNEMSGSITVDRDDPTKSSFTLTIKPETVDTNNSNRDTHLRSPDFFNVKQFPTLTFKSTSIKPVADGYQVTGDLTMHGETKSISFMLQGGKTVELPKGMHHVGFATDLVLKRSEFGMDKMLNALGDEIHISIGLEGTRR